MRTDILNDPYLPIPSKSLHQYITISHDISSSSGCTSTIHSKFSTISSLVTSLDKPSKTSEIKTGSNKNMKQTNNNNK